MSGHKPVCVNCGLFFRAKKNGAAWEKGMPVGPLCDGKPIDGTWKPYKLWEGDLWECRGCGAQIIVGTGFQAIAEHYQPDYAVWKSRVNPIVFVEDC